MPIIVQVGDRGFMKRWQEDHPGIQLFQALDDMADFIQHRAQEMAPGSLKAAIASQVETLGGPTGKRYQIAVGLRRQPKHGIFVHEGTGVFGPTKSPIFAGPGNVFVFHKEGTTRFRRFLWGQRPQPFIAEAVAMAESTYIPFRVIELGAEIT